ncbi:MAG: hypothetical protein PHW95_02390 [Patescibacteria group bacterium]|nr:hypothetical protein [Patescibacteria group bacterium]
MRFTRRDIQFQGQSAVHLSLAGIELVIFTTFLRIAHLGPDINTNLLYLDPEGKFRRGLWQLRGGLRVWWALEGADEHHGAYTPDTGPIKVGEFEDGSFVFTAPPDEMQLVKGFIIRPLADSMVDVVSFVKNAGDMLISGGIWPITCTDPVSTDAVYTSRLNSGDDAWDSFTVVHFPKWGGGHTTSDDGDGQFSQVISDGQWLHLLLPSGLEAKRAWTSPFGGQAMIIPNKDMTLFKAAPPYNHNLSYPIPGCNAAMYVGPSAQVDNPGPAMVEMEDIGPNVKLLPGEMTSLPVLFSLANQAINPTTCDLSVFTREHFLESLKLA